MHAAVKAQRKSSASASEQIDAIQREKRSFKVDVIEVTFIHF